MRTFLSSSLFLISFFMLASCATKQENPQRTISSTSIDDQKFNEFQMDIQNHSAKTFAFDWPVNEARLTRGFLPHKRRPHLGIDLAAPKGTKIFAAHDGLVIYAGREFKGFGKMILLESGYGWATIYGHLDKISVKEGQMLKQGDIIGLMGKTGRSTGVHLHFEIRRNKGPVDPLPLLPNGEKVASKVAKK